MRPGQGRLCLRLKLLPGRQARQHLPGTDAGREPGRRQRKGVPGARGEDRRQDRQQDGRQRAARAGHGEERDRGGPEGAVRGLCRRAGLRAGSLPSRGAMPRLHANSCMPVCLLVQRALSIQIGLAATGVSRMLQAPACRTLLRKQLTATHPLRITHSEAVACLLQRRYMLFLSRTCLTRRLCGLQPQIQKAQYPNTCKSQRINIGLNLHHPSKGLAR